MAAVDRASCKLRSATHEDASAINDIYAYYVRETAVTFDVEVPSLAQRHTWFERHADPRHRIIVAEVDARVVGWASSGPLRDRAAYETSVEASVYVARGSTGRGVGTALYEALLRTLAGEDVHRAYALMSLPNDASVALHERCGFVRVGLFSEQGRKFGRYWDVACYEKRLS
jgi:phosphinothricin acetyltransferase